MPACEADISGTPPIRALFTSNQYSYGLLARAAHADAEVTAGPISDAGCVSNDRKMMSSG